MPQIVPTDLESRFITHLQAKGEGLTHSNNLRHFLRFCSNNSIDIRSITYDQVTHFLSFARAKGYCNGFINNLIKVLRSFYRFLINSEGLNSSLLDTMYKVQYLKVEQKMPNYIKYEEMRDLVTAGITNVTWMNPAKTKVLLYFLFFTGVRRNELINLKRRDIDLKANNAIIRLPTKGKRERYVYYPAAVSELLRTYYRTEPETINAFNITVGQIGHFIEYLNLISPVKIHFSTHSFRHSFAKFLTRKGVDITCAQKLLGHKSITTTRMYYDPDQYVVEQIYRDKLNVKIDDGDSV